MEQKILIVGNQNTFKYLHFYRSCIHGAKVNIENRDLSLNELRTLVRQKNYTAVIVTRASVAKRVIAVKSPKLDLQNKKTGATLLKFAGAVYTLRTSIEKRPFPILIQMEEIYTAYSRSNALLFRRFIQKLLQPTKFVKQPKKIPFVHITKKSPDYVRELALKLSRAAKFASVDIETKNFPMPESFLDKHPDIKKFCYYGAARTPSGIKSKTKLSWYLPFADECGYTFWDGNKIISVTVELDCIENHKLVQQINLCEAAKIFHNGNYDNAYLCRYNMPVYNYSCDTQVMHFCDNVEMPKALADVSAWYISNHHYWKDEIGFNRAEYNAQDTVATLLGFIGQVKASNERIRRNYSLVFRSVFPNISVALKGFKVIQEKNQERRENLQKELAKEIVRFQKFAPSINANSPQQVKQLFKSMGISIPKTEIKVLNRLKFQRPIFAPLVECLIRVKQIQKELSQYVNFIQLNGRLFFQLSADGTDSGRFSSKESQFYVGTNGQNVPAKCRSQFAADDGYIFGGADLSQAESRTTAYHSKCPALIHAVENERDFHVYNAAKFFGFSQDQLFEWQADNDWRFKFYRNTVGKRVNHGANYNMGAGTLVETMGLDIIADTQINLGLNPSFTATDTAKHLLNAFDKTYPELKQKWYPALVREIHVNGTLKTFAGYERTFLDDPEADGNHNYYNTMVSFKPQSESVMHVNKAYYQLWYELEVESQEGYIMHQIHDELIFMCEGNETDLEGFDPENILVDKWSARLKELFEVPIKTFDGNEFIIPAEPKKGKYWSDLK